MQRTASAATPSRTGATKESWVSMPVEHIAGRYRGVVSNAHWLAHVLNYGADPHVIKPRRPGHRAEAWPGGEHPFAEVDHPGVRPHYMVEKALTTLVETIGWAAEPVLERFERELEAAMQMEAGRLY
jgi:hypothetical protein